MTRQIMYVSFTVIMVFLGYHIYNANAERISLANKFAAIKSSVDTLSIDTEKLEDDIEYLKEDRNLEKEARARFNYRAPNEKMIMIVPPQTRD